MKKWIVKHLQTKINPLDAELLMAHVLKKPREFVLAHPEYEVPSYKVHKVIKLLKQRERGVPLAYLTGKKEFFGLEFFVNKNVLIPRPETELMVEEVIKKLQNSDCKLKNTILIDVGAGSGCIPIAIAKNLWWSDELSPSADGRNSSSPHFVTPTIIATDISLPALALARRNAKKHNAKIKFLHGNLLSPFLSSLRKQGSRNRQTFCLDSRFRGNDNLIITANLPYLTPKQFASEPSIRHEPCLALIAGKDGLKYYKKLLSQIKSLLSTLKLYNFITFIEIDPQQTKPIKLLIKKYLPRAKIKIHQDLAGKNRVVEIGFPPL